MSLELRHVCTYCQSIQLEIKSCAFVASRQGHRSTGSINLSHASGVSTGREPASKGSQLHSLREGVKHSRHSMQLS
jgi:hypothetical protein